MPGSGSRTAECLERAGRMERGAGFRGLRPAALGADCREGCRIDMESVLAGSRARSVLESVSVGGRRVRDCISHPLLRAPVGENGPQGPAPAIAAQKTIDIDQVESALDDVDMLNQLGVAAPAPAKADSG